ncbi:MAG: HYR domain-containing protein, partial [Bacteroidota bacterium]
MLTFLLGISLNANANPPVTKTSVANGNWNSTATWGGAVPAASDNVVIAAGTTVEISIAITQTGSVTIINGGTLSSSTASVSAVTLGSLTIDNGGSFIDKRPLTVSGSTLINGGVNFGGTSTSIGPNVTFLGDVTINGIWNETTNLYPAAFNFGGNFTNNATTSTFQNTQHTFSGTSKSISGTRDVVLSNVKITGSYTNYGVLTIPNPTVSVPSPLINGGGTLINSGTLNYGGFTTMIVTLDASTYPGNLVNYTGTGQVLKVTSYQNLTLSGGAETFGAITTVGGNLILSGSATATTGANLAIGGNLTVGTGTAFTTGSSYTLTFNGSTPQQITNTGSLSVNYLTLNNASGLTINNNLTLNNNLTFTSGILSTGSNTLIMACGANVTSPSASKYVNGNLRKCVTNGTTLFEIGNSVYAPATISTMTGASGLVITAHVTTGTPPNENNPVTNSSHVYQSLKCNNYWTLNKEAGSFTSYSATFDFTNTTNLGTTSNYQIAKYSGSWSTPTGTVSGTTITGTGFNSFSDFEVGETCTPPSFTTCPANISQNPDNGVCTKLVTYTSVVTGVPTPTISYATTGATILSGSGDGSGSTFNKGTTTVTITATNSCGTAATCVFDVTVNDITPSTPGTITGNVSTCPGLTSQTYSIATDANATSYTWTVPAGWNITGGSGTNSITVTTGSAGNNGNITVTANNACGSSSQRTLAVTVNALPTVTAGNVEGCAGTA